MDSAPFELSPIDAYPSRQAWDATAAELVGTMLNRWHLTPHEAYTGGEAAAVLAVTTSDGTPAVLKVGYPHVESVWEAVGLESWGAPLAPRVLRQDAWTWSMLLERVEPGHPLTRSGLEPLEAVEAAARLYAALAKSEPATGIPTLREAMTPFYEQARARLGDDPALEAGLAVLGELIALDDAQAMLHGDYNPGNVLQSNEGWVVIDPSPMLGNPAFDLWPLVSQLGDPFGHARPAEVLLPHLELACAITGVDLAAATRWAVARSALNVSWFLDDGDGAAAAKARGELAVWSALADA